MKIIKTLRLKNILHHTLLIIHVRLKKKMKWFKKRYKSNRDHVLNKKEAIALINDLNQTQFNKNTFELYKQENLEIEDLEKI